MSYAAVPLACFVLIFLCLCQRDFNQNYPIGWPQNLLLAAILWATLLVLITELLSLGRNLTLENLLVAWSLAGGLGLVYLSRLKSQGGPVAFRWPWPAIPPSLKIFLGLVAFVVGIVGLIALVAPPNTDDSLAYHMSRVAHWIQNKSVMHYPTPMNRQLFMSPWAEFCITHFQVLTRSDRLANAVQWFSFVGSLVGVSAIARRLEGDARAQVYAAVIAATIPMAILEGSSTQNDLVLSFWLVCIAYFTLTLTQGPFVWSNLVALALSSGLAFLTKGTAYCYVVPFLVWLVFKGRTWSASRRWSSLLWILVIPLILNAGHFWRNFDLYGNPLGPGTRYQNESFLPAAIASNIVRNVSVHLSSPWPAVNDALQNTVLHFHALLRLSASDPRTTWGTGAFTIHPFVLNENYSGNPLHLFLIAGMLMTTIRRPGTLRRDARGGYLMAVLGQGFMFCVLLKWQPWHSRLQLPLFVLSAPLLAIGIRENLNERLCHFILASLIVFVVPFLIFHDIRPLFGPRSILYVNRETQYFAGSPQSEQPLRLAAKKILETGCRDIGFSVENSNWPEYLWWVALGSIGNPQLRLEHSQVTNETKARYRVAPFDGFVPCGHVTFQGGARSGIRPEQ